MTCLYANEFFAVPVDLAHVVNDLVVQNVETLLHSQCAILLVDVSSLAEGRFYDVAIIVVVLDVVLEDIGSCFCGNDVVHDELAVTREEISLFVQFLNFRVLVVLV